MAWLRRICFILLGITSFVEVSDPLNSGRLMAGVLVGILFGFVATTFYRSILWMMNPKLNKTLDKKVIKEVVNKGMLFLLPFTVMAMIAVFVLGWQVQGVFVSAALMSVGVVSSNELEKYVGKSKLRNTLASMVVSGGFASLWLLTINKVKFLPTYITGGYDLIRSLLESRM